MELQEWLDSREVKGELPSGLSIKVLKVGILDVTMLPNVPSSLFEVFVDKEEKEDKPPETINDKFSSIRESLGIAKTLAPVVLVDPPYDTVKNHLTADDYLFIFGLATGAFVLQSLKRLAEQQENDKKHSGAVQSEPNVT